MTSQCLQQPSKIDKNSLKFYRFTTQVERMKSETSKNLIALHSLEFQPMTNGGGDEELRDEFHFFTSLIFFTIKQEKHKTLDSPIRFT